MKSGKVGRESPPLVVCRVNLFFLVLLFTSLARCFNLLPLPSQVKLIVFNMRTKNSFQKKLMCKKCGLVVNPDNPLVKDGNHDLGQEPNNGDGPSSSQDQNQDPNDDEKESDEEESEVPFAWPTQIDESIQRTMPPVSAEHRARIDRLKNDGIIVNQQVYEIMMSLDLAIFYDNITDEWIEHSYIMLERSSEVVKEGHHILVFPYNTYYSVALSLMAGPKGAVMCYGHLQNSYTLKKCGLEWLMNDHRLNFRNRNDALYYALPLQTFFETGWPRMAPYDIIMMSDQELTGAVIDQVSEEGLVFRPDTADILYRNHAGM